MTLGPRRAFGLALDAKETVGVQTQHPRPHHVDGVQRVADDHLLRGEAWVQPVQRRLAFLEVMQVDPAPRFAVDASDDRRGTPVGFLDPRFEEDHPLQLTDDVMLVSQRINGGGRQVDRVAASRDLRQQRPVFLLDFDHVVKAGVVLVRQFGQAEIRTLAGVGRNHVVDDHRVVRSGNPAEAEKLRIGAQVGIHFEADAVEIAVDARGALAALETTGGFQRTVVNALNADFGQGVPERFIAQRFQHRTAFASHDRRRIGGEPHRSNRRSVPRPGQRIGPLPESALATIEFGALFCGVEHRLLNQPFHVLLVRGGHRVQGSVFKWIGEVAQGAHARGSGRSCLRRCLSL
jgi:hypothetical protein